MKLRCFFMNVTLRPLHLQGEADGAGSMQQAFDYGANFTAWLAATRCF
jgi:hypothetical protein